MANYQLLKADIDAKVYQNGQQKITGENLNSVLNAMVTTLGAEYQFAGVATIDTKPETFDAKVFYIANGKGKYTYFGGIEITEDDVVILYYDTSWHKVATGIASQEKLTELDSQIEDEANARTKADAELQTQINGKQEALTLTVKDNGNIVLANIQGQSKEFMPATPSGDPMHYAYVAAGAEYNDTGEDIVKDAPWADLADDDADKTVVHKAGYWYLNGLGDITNDEIRDSYNKSIGCLDVLDISEYLQYVDLRTNFSKYIAKGGYSNMTMNLTFSNSNIEVITFTKNSYINFKYNITQCVRFAGDSNNLRHILGCLSFSSIVVSTRANQFLINCTKLNTIKLFGLKIDINLDTCGALSIKSVLYMINNEGATSPITITLHADVYNRCMANADILAALQAHTNISLASA